MGKSARFQMEPQDALLQRPRPRKPRQREDGLRADTRQPASKHTARATTESSERARRNRQELNQARPNRRRRDALPPEQLAQELPRSQ